MARKKKCASRVPITSRAFSGLALRQRSVSGALPGRHAGGFLPLVKRANPFLHNLHTTAADDR